MREFTIEEKAKRYDEAIEELRGLLEGIHEEKCDIMEEDIIKIFPELKESEDEKIRKVLVDYFTAYKEQKECGIKTFYGIPTDSIIAWLEKQGEQRPKLVDFDLNANDSDLQEETYFIPNGFHAEIIGDKVVIKRGEQKPWSEEDERHKRQILRILKDNRCSQALQERTEKWIEERLKSLNPQNPAWSEEDIVAINCAVEALSKDLPSLAASIRRLKQLSTQYAWKPSDEQMDALLYIFRHYKTPAATDKLALEALQTLGLMLEQLKKLREPKPTRV